jgi:hypothetical protein
MCEREFRVRDLYPERESVVYPNSKRVNVQTLFGQDILIHRAHYNPPNPMYPAYGAQIVFEFTMVSNGYLYNSSTFAPKVIDHLVRANRVAKMPLRARIVRGVRGSYDLV